MSPPDQQPGGHHIKEDIGEKFLFLETLVGKLFTQPAGNLSNTPTHEPEKTRNTTLTWQQKKSFLRLTLKSQ